MGGEGEVGGRTFNLKVAQVARQGHLDAVCEICQRVLLLLLLTLREAVGLQVQP